LDNFQNLSGHSVAALLSQAQDCSVYAWGLNTMGQCGLGNAHSPIVSPQKILALDGIPIHQVRGPIQQTLLRLQ
jgi:alpha-tubulin suppressor-like RCC1 family protein